MEHFPEFFHHFIRAQFWYKVVLLHPVIAEIDIALRCLKCGLSCIQLVLAFGKLDFGIPEFSLSVGKLAGCKAEPAFGFRELCLARFQLFQRAGRSFFGIFQHSLAVGNLCLSVTKLLFCIAKLLLAVSQLNFTVMNLLFAFLKLRLAVTELYLTFGDLLLAVSQLCFHIADLFLRFCELPVGVFKLRFCVLKLRLAVGQAFLIGVPYRFIPQRRALGGQFFQQLLHGERRFPVLFGKVIVRQIREGDANPRPVSFQRALVKGFLRYDYVVVITYIVGDMIGMAEKSRNGKLRLRHQQRR